VAPRALTRAPIALTAPHAIVRPVAAAAAHAALGFEEVEQIRCFRKPLAGG